MARGVDGGEGCAWMDAQMERAMDSCCVRDFALVGLERRDETACGAVMRCGCGVETAAGLWAWKRQSRLLLLLLLSGNTRQDRWM
jgi:hypothetical protein